LGENIRVPHESTRTANVMGITNDVSNVRRRSL